MKIIYFIYIAFYCSILLFGCNNDKENIGNIKEQKINQEEKINRIAVLNSCSYSNKSNAEAVNFYNPEIEAEHAIEKIMKLVGLPSNFKIKRANVENAMATIIQTDSGTFERFIGILIEQYAGKFPLWLSPVQVVIATVTNEADNYANEVFKLLEQKGIRAELDSGSDKISYKIREHSLRKVPIILAVGKKEIEDRKVSMRRLGSDKQEILALDEVIDKITQEATIPY